VVSLQCVDVKISSMLFPFRDFAISGCLRLVLRLAASCSAASDVSLAVTVLLALAARTQFGQHQHETEDVKASKLTMLLITTAAVTHDQATFVLGLTYRQTLSVAVTRCLTCVAVRNAVGTACRSGFRVAGGPCSGWSQ
jgi:hypothetical protein